MRPHHLVSVHAQQPPPRTYTWCRSARAALPLTVVSLAHPPPPSETGSPITPADKSPCTPFGSRRRPASKRPWHPPDTVQLQGSESDDWTAVQLERLAQLAVARERLTDITGPSLRREDYQLHTKRLAAPPWLGVGRRRPLATPMHLSIYRDEKDITKTLRCVSR